MMPLIILVSIFFVSLVILQKHWEKCQRDEDERWKRRGVYPPKKSRV